MTGADARAFAEQWTAAWNALDLDRVLAHFHEDVRFTSPTAAAIVGLPTVRGKQALREYWNTAIGRVGSLRFAVERVSWDPDTRELAIIYDPCIVVVKGGKIFTNASVARFAGATAGGSVLKVGWVLVGFEMEIWQGLIRIRSSPVRSISIEAS